MNTINVVMGDWSNDGHGKTETIMIESNLNSQEIHDAYAAGTKKVGFDFINKVADEYQDSSISEEQEDMLYKYKIFAKTEENCLCTDTYFEVWAAIVKLGNEEFTYTIKKGEQIRIGGYGLFY